MPVPNMFSVIAKDTNTGEEKISQCGIHLLTTLTLYTDFEIAKPFHFDAPLSAGFQGFSASTGVRIHLLPS